VGGFAGAWKLSCIPSSIVPRRFAWLYAWMGIIGLGSFLFHATLKYSMQLLDEIPMLFSNAQLLYCL
jgi:dihydroceramidase